MTWSAGFVDDPVRQCHGKRTYATRAEAKRLLHIGHPPGSKW